MCSNEPVAEGLATRLRVLLLWLLIIDDQELINDFLGIGFTFKVEGGEETFALFAFHLRFLPLKGVLYGL